MPGKIQQELKQTRPFDSLSAEAFLNLVRTTDRLMRVQESVLKSAGVSLSQYNVLRILRGAGPEGLPCGEIADRMVQRDPDITRLVDRLEKRGVVVRERETRDRRVVRVKITDVGLRTLKELDRPVRDAVEGNLGHLGQRRLRDLVTLLESIREGMEAIGKGERT